MQIVTDTAADMVPDETLNIHVVPQSFTLDGRTYQSGVNIDVPGFYRLLAGTKNFPATSQPAPGEFAEVYRKLAKTDPNILSVHISSGLSGTLNAAREGAKMAPEANVTLWDSKTLSAALGWHVLTAANGAKEGWTLERILAALENVHRNIGAVFTLDDLKYLVHGGRVSHIKGMLVNLLDLKPLIGVNKETGMYDQLRRARTIKKALSKLVDVALEKHAPGTALRIQVIHGDAPNYVEYLKAELASTFECNFMPTVQVSPVLAAHTGPALVGYCFLPETIFADLPSWGYSPPEKLADLIN